MRRARYRGDPDKWEAFPASFPSFSPLLELVSRPGQIPASVYTPAFLSPWHKELSQSRLLDKPQLVLLTSFLRYGIIYFEID